MGWVDKIHKVLCHVGGSSLEVTGWGEELDKSPSFILSGHDIFEPLFEPISRSLSEHFPSPHKCFSYDPDDFTIYKQNGFIGWDAN